MAAAAGARGKHATLLLRENINDQLNRLLTQLEDLEELKDEFDAAEYEETKQETLDQLRDFQAFLEKAVSGDMTLVDEFGAAQLAIQAAVSEAFKTPEVIRMFANGDKDQLRRRLATLRRDVKLQKLSKEAFNGQAAEILIALKKMGDELTEEEQRFLDQTGNTRHLESAVSTLGSSTQASLVAAASAEVQAAEQ